MPVFILKHLLISPERTGLTPAVMRWTYCNRSFPTQKDLELHQLQIIITGETPHFCTLVSKYIQLQTLLYEWDLSNKFHMGGYGLQNSYAVSWDSRAVL